MARPRAQVEQAVLAALLLVALVALGEKMAKQQLAI
jgi:hypothetical protein